MVRIDRLADLFKHEDLPYLNKVSEMEYSN